jgi:hypothetical protein
MCILHERPTEMLEQWNMIRRYRDVAIGISIFSYRLGFDRGSLHRFLGLPHDRYTHAFGWDNLLEMYNLSGCFDSIDSSLCVSAVINDVDLKKIWQITRDPVKDGCKISGRLPIDWDDWADPENKYKVVQNIQMLTKFCLDPPVFRESDLP